MTTTTDRDLATAQNPYDSSTIDPLNVINALTARGRNRQGVRYLFNDFVLRDICTYMTHELIQNTAETMLGEHKYLDTRNAIELK